MSKINLSNITVTKKKIAFFPALVKDLKRNKSIYLMLVPVIVYYIVFCYYPLYGAQIAFKDFSPFKGIEGSPWVGLKHFKDFLSSIYFTRLLGNTILINFYNLIFGFPAPIILALLLNEVTGKKFKSSIQTISYLPHFISSVIICGMVLDFTSTEGFITNILTKFGFLRQNLLLNPALFKTIYVSSDIWQGIGWGSILYIAALSAISQEQYEAAIIDGANKWKQMIHVTLPGIAPTITIMLILRVGNMMSLGFEKVFLLYNPAIYQTADIISTYVYRKGMIDMSFSFSTAVGLFNSVVNFVLLVSVNYLSRKYNENSVW